MSILIQPGVCGRDWGTYQPWVLVCFLFFFFYCYYLFCLSGLNSVQEIFLVLPHMGWLQLHCVPPDSEARFTQASAIPRGQAEGSAKQPKKKGYFQWMWLLDVFFADMFIYTVHGCTANPQARPVFTNAIPRGGTHALSSLSAQT